MKIIIIIIIIILIMIMMMRRVEGSNCMLGGNDEMNFSFLPSIKLPFDETTLVEVDVCAVNAVQLRDERSHLQVYGKRAVHRVDVQLDDSMVFSSWGEWR